LIIKFTINENFILTLSDSH